MNSILQDKDDANDVDFRSSRWHGQLSLRALWSGSHQLFHWKNHVVIVDRCELHFALIVQLQHDLFEDSMNLRTATLRRPWLLPLDPPMCQLLGRQSQVERQLGVRRFQDFLTINRNTFAQWRRRWHDVFPNEPTQ